MLQLLVAYLLVQATIGQSTCQGPTNPLYSNGDLNNLTTCQQINGNLILGDKTCTIPCTITDFTTLNNIHTITGSFIIQCCNQLTTLPSPAKLTKVQGTLRVYYNSNLRGISGLILATAGNIDISQNQLLQTIQGLQELAHTSGYISISYNPSLTSITGFNKLTSIQGNNLVNGHALTITYNGELTDISGFKTLDTIDYGTVHIEGNTRLCYAGYPTWNYGSYGLRYSNGDKGIDWRSKLTTQTHIWQFTWGEAIGIPTLLIQNNGNITDCASATCHSSCTTGAGCLGPNEQTLCGRCYQTSSINSCDEISAPSSESQVCVVLWPPTELPFSAIFGLVVGLGGTLIIIVLIAVLVVVYKIRKKFGDANKGSYSVHSTLESGGNTASSPDRSRNAYDTNSYERDDSMPIYAKPNKNKKTTQIEMKATASSSYEPVEANGVKSRSPNFRESQREEEWSDNEDDEERNLPPSSRKENSLSEEGEDEEERIDLLEFPSKKIQLMKEIGQGDFGKVYEALAGGILPDEKVTQIVVKECRSYATEEEQESFLQPAEAMRHLKHENVLGLLGVSVDGRNLMILLEYCMHGNLKTYLRKNRSRMASMKRDGTLLRMIIDIGKGLHYLHTMNISHNDVAARNCLVCADYKVKIGDYGLSRKTFRADYYTRTPGQTAWPIRWMAPEIILDKSNGMLDSLDETEESNIWSFGVLMWEMCTFCEQPYTDMTDEEVIEQLNTQEYCNLQNPVPAPDPLKPLFSIMRKCWKTEQERATVNEILNLLENANIDTGGSGDEHRGSNGKHKKFNGLKGARPQSEQVTSEKPLTSFQVKKARRTSQQEPLLRKLSSNEEEETNTLTKKVTEKKEEKKEEAIEEVTDQETKKEEKEPAKSAKETKSSKKSSKSKLDKQPKKKKESKKTKSKEPSPPEPKKPSPPEPKKPSPPEPKEPSPKLETKNNDDDDIDDMDDIFYPSGSGPPPIFTGKPPSEDESHSEDEVTPPPPPLPVEPPPTGPPPSNRLSKESWDSFDDEETGDYPPPPPVQFSQDDDDFDNDMPVLPLPTDDPPTNDWEESEPVSPVKLSEGTSTEANQTIGTSQMELLQDNSEPEDDPNTEPVEPVRFDSVDDRGDEVPAKQEKTKAKEKKKEEKEKKKEAEKQKKKKKSSKTELSDENEPTDFAW